MDLLASLATVVAGLAMLLVSADWFVRPAGLAAAGLNLSPVTVGLTLVAFGTSLPEMAVSVKAALDGSPGLSMGNVVGSNLANSLLILGICAVIARIGIDRDVVRRDGAVWIAATAALVAFALTGGSSDGWRRHAS